MRVRIVVLSPSPLRPLRHTHMIGRPLPLLENPPSGDRQIARGESPTQLKQERTRTSSSD